MAKAAATKRYRRLAREAVEAQRIESGPWEQATVQSKFFYKVKRRRDDVNHVAMLKPAYDGVVDAGLLIDDDSEHLTTLPTSFEIDRDRPRVVIVFTKIK